jgi:MoaA/NifB/PqqE/SkfB family radical SAM enzyme
MVKYPQQLTLVITTKCNLRCKVCFQSDYSSDFNLDFLEKIAHVIPKVEWLHPMGGEPLLRDLSLFFSFARDHHCKIKLITNGTLITDKIAADLAAHTDRLIVSIDGGSYEAYLEMRGTSLTKALEGIGRVQIQKAIAGSATPVIEINSLLTQTTISSLPTLALRAQILGVQCINVFYPSFSTTELMKLEGLDTTDHAKEMIKGARKYLDIIEPENRGGSICRRPWNTCIIDVNANVFGCCYGSPALGNLNHNSFDDCWFGPMAQRLRATVNTDQEIEACKRCIVRILPQQINS